MRTVELPGVLIGKSLAADLGVRPGDPIVVISPASLGVGAGTPRLRRFVVEGFFFSGMYEFDSSLMFAPLPDVQALLADDYQADRGLEVRVDDLFAAPRIAQAIAAMAGPGYQVTNWTEDNAALFDALKLEKFTYFLVLLLIVLVAAFNIVATLVMVVKERRKEIAILRAMGARAGFDRMDLRLRRGGARRHRDRPRRRGGVYRIVSDWPLSLDSFATRSVYGQRRAGAPVRGEFPGGGGCGHRVMPGRGALSRLAGASARAGRSAALRMMPPLYQSRTAGGPGVKR